MIALSLFMNSNRYFTSPSLIWLNESCYLFLIPMTEQNTTLLQKIGTILVLATLVASVLLVLPFTEGFVFQTKLYLFIFVTLALGVVFSINALQRKTIEIVYSPFSVPLLLFSIAILASTFFTSDYPVESLLGIGGIFLATSFFVMFATTVATRDVAHKLLLTAGVTGAVLSVLTAAQLAGYGPANILNQMFGIGLPTTLQFSLAGASFFALQFLVVVAVGMVADSVIKKHIAKTTAILFPILLIGIAVHIWSILPGKPAQMVSPSWISSWSVALDTIRSPRAALIGAGPASYTNLYLRFKPAWVNSTPEWSVPFDQGSNFPLTLLTTTGFLGLLTWIFLVIQIFRTSKKATGTNKAISYMLLATIVLQLLFPANVVMLIFQAVLLVALIIGMKDQLPVLSFQALTIHSQQPGEMLRAPRKVSFPVYLTVAVIGLGILLSGYVYLRSYQASLAFFSSSKAAQANDAVGVYESQQRAVSLNPYLDTYRRQYAITNILIASSLANKTDATEADKAQVAELLQQAVREARSATLLDPLDVENWAVLAQIYQNMVGAAEQADQFAVQSYVQAVENDPTNPNLRVQLGGIFLAQKQFQQAASLFKQSVDLKPDFANGYYNLAFTLKELGAFEDADAAYKALLQLIPADSEDYAKVKAEMDEIAPKVAEQKAAREAQEKQQAEAQAAGQGGQTQGGQAQTGQQTQGGSSEESPSLLDQNIQQGSGADLVNEPADGDLDVTPPTPTATPAAESTTPPTTPTP